MKYQPGNENHVKDSGDHVVLPNVKVIIVFSNILFWIFWTCLYSSHPFITNICSFRWCFLLLKRSISSFFLWFLKNSYRWNSLISVAGPNWPQIKKLSWIIWNFIFRFFIGRSGHWIFWVADWRIIYWTGATSVWTWTSGTATIFRVTNILGTNW